MTQRVEPKSCLVLGNGYSLKNYPFNQYNVDTIGISQAYRYWNHIKWWPTYYVCLDQNVNENFAKDIKYLIKHSATNGIKKFLLTKRILDIYPKIKKYKNVLFIENLNNSHTRGFNGDSLITSGSYAARFAIYLGYTKVYLLGIDAHYRPIDKKWIKEVSDSNQRLIKTINPEPDYFFIGYRQKGDYLHIPPKRRWLKRPNHLETFIKINKEFNRSSTPIIYNSSVESLLHGKKILPYTPIPTSFLSNNKDKEIISIDVSNNNTETLNETTISKDTSLVVKKVLPQLKIKSPKLKFLKKYSKNFFDRHRSKTNVKSKRFY